MSNRIKTKELKVTKNMKVKGKFNTKRVHIIPYDYVKIIFNQSNKIGNLININLSLFMKEIPENENVNVMLPIANIRNKHNYPVNVIAISSINSGTDDDTYDYNSIPVTIRPNGIINVKNDILDNTIINIVVTYAVGSTSSINLDEIDIESSNNAPYKLNFSNEKRRQINQELKEQRHEEIISKLLEKIKNSPDLIKNNF